MCEGMKLNSITPIASASDLLSNTITCAQLSKRRILSYSHSNRNEFRALRGQTLSDVLERIEARR